MNRYPVIIILRSLVFNIAFFSLTTLTCVFLLWTLLVPGHKVMMSIIRAYLKIVYWLERKIIGLDFQVRGLENLPKDNRFILAAKHQSAWETMKIHTLVKDPVIILKEELKYLPFWGWYAAKAGFVFVKRSQGGKSVHQLLFGARQAIAEGRPIVIFPQGTRVSTGVHKPYKVGAGLLYQRLGLPIVPMALNSGNYWSRRGFIKLPGTIEVEFLPPIKPGLPIKKAIQTLQMLLEEATDRLDKKVVKNY